MLGNYSGHAPFAPTNRALMIFSNVRFVTSACLSAWGCPKDEYLFFMLGLEQNNLNPWLLNWQLLSEMIVYGISNLQTIFFHTKLRTFTFVIVASASASTHFVKQSITTSKNFTYFFPYDRGPIMSILHYANGQGEDMVIIFSLGTCWTFLYLWHLSHFLTKSAASCCIVGQK